MREPLPEVTTLVLGKVLGRLADLAAQLSLEPMQESNSSSTNSVAVGMGAGKNVDGTENVFIGWNVAEGALFSVSHIKCGHWCSHLYMSSAVGHQT